MAWLAVSGAGLLFRLKARRDRRQEYGDAERCHGAEAHVHCTSQEKSSQRTQHGLLGNKTPSPRIAQKR
jgi:hypothetical protein